MAPRGIRNNNPGNIRVGNKWRGEATPNEMTEVQQNEREFEVFSAPEWGMRAMVILLRKYFTQYKRRTVGDIGRSWTATDVGPWIATVAHAVNVEPTTPINVLEHSVMRDLVKGITLAENGEMPYTNAQIEHAIELADLPVTREEPPTIPARWQGLIRHVLGVLGAVLVTRGVLTAEYVPLLTSDTTVELVFGLGTIAIAALWSFLDRNKRIGEGDL